MAGPLSGLIDLFKSDRMNLPKQIGAVQGMNPQQATSYRQQVNTVLPKIPVQPPATLPTPKQGSMYSRGMETLSKVQPAARQTVSATVNPLQTGAEGLARLPAARNMGEGVTDLADILAGVLQGATQLHGARGLISAGAQHPEWVTNQVGGATLAKRQPMTIEQLAEQAGGWKNAGDRAKFDTAMLNNDSKVIKELLPRVPDNYLQNRFGPEIYQKLLNAARGTNLPNPNMTVAQAPVARATDLMNLSGPKDQVVGPNGLKQLLNWFYK